eukprot:jgi/Chrzof1/3804/Cz13g09130.t1
MAYLLACDCCITYCNNRWVLVPQTLTTVLHIQNIRPAARAVHTCLCWFIKPPASRKGGMQAQVGHLGNSKLELLPVPCYTLLPANQLLAPPTARQTLCLQ